MLLMGRKKTGRTGKALHVWLDADLQEALKAYSLATRPHVSVTAIMETLIEDFLREHDAWPLPVKPSNGNRK